MFTSVGNISLATLNVCYALACLFGPTVVEKLSVKKTFVISAFAYCRACILRAPGTAVGLAHVFFNLTVWVAAVIPGIPALFVVASAVQGTAAGLIWISHGVRDELSV